MNHPEKILRITLLIKLMKRAPSNCQNCTSKIVTVFHVPSMQELSESDLKLEEIEIPDTLPNLEIPRMRMLELVDLLFQHQTWLENDHLNLYLVFLDNKS